MFHNKKASTMDNFFVLIQIFGFAIFLLVMYVAWEAMTSTSLDDDLWLASSVGNSMKANAQTAFDNYDWITVLIYFGLHIGVLVLVFLLRSHPVVYVAGLILIVILIMVAVPLSNAWEDISDDGEFATASANIPKVNFIMSKLPLFEMIWGFLSLIVLAALARGEGFL